jgi:hypothetical protein
MGLNYHKDISPAVDFGQYFSAFARFVDWFFHTPPGLKLSAPA